MYRFNKWGSIRYVVCVGEYGEGEEWAVCRVGKESVIIINKSFQIGGVRYYLTNQWGV